MMIISTDSRQNAAIARARRIASEDGEARGESGLSNVWRSPSGRIIAVRLGFDWEIVELTGAELGAWRIAAMRAEAMRLGRELDEDAERMRTWRPATRAQLTAGLEAKRARAALLWAGALVEEALAFARSRGVTINVLARTGAAVDQGDEVAA